VVSNETLSAITGLDAAWISNRSGITRRHLARPGVGTVHMATVAAREALAHAGVEPEDIGLVVVASSFHRRFPAVSTAEMVRAKLGLMRAAGLDLCSTFSGFAGAMRSGASAVREGAVAALVIGAEGFSDATRLRDRRTCYMLSDGAGALVLSGHGGFARIGPVQTQTMEVPEGDGPSLECALTPAADSAVWKAFQGAIGAVTASNGEGVIHVPTQHLRAIVDGLPQNVRLHHPLGGTGNLLAASLPLSLYHFLRAGEYADGDRILLFGTDGVTAWNICLLDQLRKLQRQWDDLREEDELALARGRELTQRGVGAQLRICPRSELERHIADVASHAARQMVNLACVTFRVSAPSCADLEWVDREATALLLKQVRATDLLYKLKDASCHVLLLRYIDEANARRLGARLKRLLEDLDLAGELTLSVDMTVSVHDRTESSAAFSTEVLGRP